MLVKKIYENVYSQMFLEALEVPTVLKQFYRDLRTFVHRNDVKSWNWRNVMSGDVTELQKQYCIS